jgi:hypothetical protein
VVPAGRASWRPSSRCWSAGRADAPAATRRRRLASCLGNRSAASRCPGRTVKWCSAAARSGYACPSGHLGVRPRPWHCSWARGCRREAWVELRLEGPCCWSTISPGADRGPKSPARSWPSSRYPGRPVMIAIRAEADWPPSSAAANAHDHQRVLIAPPCHGLRSTGDARTDRGI